MSPELALVDAALAAHLRTADVPVHSRPTVAHLHLAWDEADAVEPVEVTVGAPVADTEENDPLADLIVQESGPPVAEPTTVAGSAPVSVDVDEDDAIADLIAGPSVEEPEHQAETSRYPALPAPVDDGPEPMDATETALREIRERLTTPPAPAKRKRRFRRRFVVASGLSTAVALGVFAANVSYGVTPLPI